MLSLQRANGCAIYLLLQGVTVSPREFIYKSVAFLSIAGTPDGVLGPRSRPFEGRYLSDVGHVKAWNP